MWIKQYAPPRFALCRVKILREKTKYALVAELADAYGSGPYFLTEVQVQFLSGAPLKARFYRAFFIMTLVSAKATRRLCTD